MSTSPHYKGVKDESTIMKNGDNVTIKPTALDVTWGNDPRYWSIDKNAGRISLLQVSWLEVTGTFDKEIVSLDTSKLYSLKFRVKMKADAFGWSGCPVYLMVKDADNSKFKWKKVDLSRLNVNAEQGVLIPEEKHLFKPSPDKLIFGLFEIWRGRWKGGLEILEVIIEKT